MDVQIKVSYFRLDILHQKVSIMVKSKTYNRPPINSSKRREKSHNGLNFLDS